MKLILGADHGGFELKQQIKQWLVEKGYTVEDMGADQLDPQDDYPDFAEKVARKVAEEETAGRDAAGILFCRSGGGMVITANKIKGIRAVDIYDKKSAAHAKAHNNANVIAVGGDWLPLNDAIEVIEVFLQTGFAQEERHLRRINKIAKLDK